MAHEATHVMQQTGEARRKPVQREAAGGGAPSSGPWDFEGKKGKVRKGSAMSLPVLSVPKFKLPFTKGPITLPKKDDDPRPDTQRAVWAKDIKTKGGIKSKLEEKLLKEKAPKLSEAKQPINYLKLKSKDVYVIGTPEVIAERLVKPYWTKEGEVTSFQVDHKLELQLGGGEGADNLWLLEADANMSSGRNIRAEKNRRIQEAIDEAAAKDLWAGGPPTLETVRKSYNVTFEKVVGNLPVEGKPAINWSPDAVGTAVEHLEPLKTLTAAEVRDQGLRGSAEKIVIYTNEAGGGVRKVKWDEGATSMQVKGVKFGSMLSVDTVNYNQGTGKGSISGNAFRGNKLIEQIDFTFDLDKTEAVDYGGYVSASKVTKDIQSKLKLKGLSPIVIEYAELTDRGLVGRGKVLPTVPLIQDVGIELILDGDDIYLRKIFSAEEFKFPGPIKATGATIEIFAGTKGLGVQGNLFFEIDRVGKGKVTGEGSTGKGFMVAGEFDFDSKLFEPATIKAKYADGKFSASGEIGIPPGKVKGIKSASLVVTLEEGVLDAKGSVKPAIPGVEQADLAVRHSEAEGLTISGHLDLAKDIPGISAGSVDVLVSKPPGVEDFKVKATGKATPKIPGINSEITVTYDDGAFDILGTAAYQKGMLSGSLTVGATNRPVGEDGNPAGAPPDKGADKITLYGGGSLSLKIAPWLQATAGVKLKPNGEVEVTGRIGLPAVLELFPEKKLDKNLFKVGIDIPIVGVAVLGQRIGIFANISGGLDLAAGIGPGQLQDLFLEVTYNPAHEEETHVKGAAKLHIPANAGLRMFVRGSLGVGIPIVSASAGLEIGGGLGLEGALDAAVNVDWTPTTGLDIQASAEISVQPKLKFDITGFVLVEADLWIKTIELYSKRWQLAAMEYGSDLKFGVRLPIHYKEGQPFNLSFDNVEFITPNISASDVLSGLIKKIA
jgi:hypothetical protein